MKKQDGDSVWYEGFCIDLFKELAKILKFTYEFYPTPDGYYGAKTENGTWNGLIGELIEKVYNYVYENLYPKTCVFRVETSEASTRRPLRVGGVLGLIFAGYVPLASHYSLIFKIQIFFTFIALFQELTMKKK